jgi:hypothetical protein
MSFFQIVSSLNTSGTNGLNGMIQAIPMCALRIACIPEKTGITD